MKLSVIKILLTKPLKVLAKEYKQTNADFVEVYNEIVEENNLVAIIEYNRYRLPRITDLRR